MDTIEATKMVMSRIHTIDPENASKIMGYILLQDNGENEMIRLAFGPENLLASIIKQAKAFLDISSNTSSAPLSPSHFPHQTPPQIVIPDNGYNHMNHPPFSPHSPWSFCNNVNEVTAEDYSSICGGGGTGVHDDADVWRRCMYFAGSKFVYGNGDGGFGDEMCLGSSSPTAVFESPRGVNIDGFEDLLRIEAMQEQGVATMAAMGSQPFCFNRCINFVRSPSEAAAAVMMRGDFHKFGRFRPHRHDLAAMGLGNSSSSSRQIYLTFPADSTFKEEDISNYFSIFGPVQDVRIPYQQKRMFGFVAFVLTETVKSVLAKGNPHFVCDSRVLVKPYKEKGTFPFKKHHHQIARGDFSVFESAEPFDHIPFGARMFNHDMKLRRNLEDQDEYQQTVDLQERKLMNMQLTMEHQLHHSLSPQTDQSLVHVSNLNVYGEEINGSDTQELLTEGGSDSKVPQEVNDEDTAINNGDRSYIHESVEYILPDNLFASPTKTAATDHQSIFSSSIPEVDDAGGCANMNQTSVNMTSLKSC